MNNQLNFLTESCSDVGSAMFEVTHGAYKAAKMMLRSSIETFLKGFTIDELSKIDKEKSVHAIFDDIKKLDFFKTGVRKRFFTIMHADYKTLCETTHTATVLDMQHITALGYFPKFDEAEAHKISDIMLRLVSCYNKDSYSIYCREYKEYQEWEAKRNEQRYQSTLSHGKSYDAKNMMHTFRLLSMAEEIALYQHVIVKRDDRDFLLEIRNGVFELDDLIQMVEEKMEQIKVAYEKSSLPDKPNPSQSENLLVNIREEFYNK